MWLYERPRDVLAMVTAVVRVKSAPGREKAFLHQLLFRELESL